MKKTIIILFGLIAIATARAQLPNTAIPDSTSKTAQVEDSTIRIRGISKLTGCRPPTYIVDGMIVDADRVQRISPSQIEKLVVLKDASIYATVFSGPPPEGIILITTKNGLKEALKSSKEKKIKDKKRKAEKKL